MFHSSISFTEKKNHSFLDKLCTVIKTFLKIIKDSLHNKKLDFKTNSKIETCEIMKEGSSEKNQLKKS